MVKAEDGAALSDPDGFPGPVFAMLRALLAERFGLVTHNEVRERPVYALTLARADRRLGTGLKPTGTDCAEAMRKLVAPLPGRRPHVAPLRARSVARRVEPSATTSHSRCSPASCRVT